MNAKTNGLSSHPQKRHLPGALLLGLFTLALLLRLTDLKDEPLDFNPARQLYSAIIARAIYYERLPDADPARRATALAHRNSLEPLEPPILETLVAQTYLLLGAEQVWVARVYVILFWLAGGLALYAFSRAVLQPAISAYASLLPLAYYFFLPLAVYASRSFQPDPGMVALLAAFAWAAHRWAETRAWKWAALAGVFGGLAGAAKGVGAYFVGMGAVFLVVSEAAARVAGENLPGMWQKVGRVARRVFADRQVWLVAVLALAPLVVSYADNLAAAVARTATGGSSSLYTRSVLYRWQEVLTPSFYMRWLIIVDRLLGLPVTLAAFGGVWLAPRRARALLLGLWAGYALYGISFPRLIVTHDYYHLPLVLIVALSLAPLAGLVVERLRAAGLRLAFAGALALAIAYNGWLARAVLLAENFAHAPAFWQTVGQAIPEEGRAVGYSQDYGFRLMYYGWRRIDILPEGLAPDEFLRLAGDADYFVVTAKNQMSGELAEYARAHFPVLAEGGGYTVYDLRP